MNMPAQGTDQWLKQREGKLTASVIGKVIIGNGKDEVLRDMVREALGHPRLFTGNAVSETGFHLHHLHRWMGASPDGLVGDDGLIEVKCPYGLRNASEVPETRVNLIDRDLYWHQMQCQMHVMGRQWCDFCVFHPDFAPADLIIKRVKPDAEMHWQFSEKVPVYMAEIKRVLNKVAIQKQDV